jgi:ribosomal protein S18 acetylase RimI-like enzyme
MRSLKAVVGPGVRRAAAVRVREAVAADEEVLAQLRLQAEERHARLLPDYFRVPRGERAATVAGSGAAVLVAVVGSAVRGYVALKMVDTPRDPTVTPRRRAHVETVVVDGEHRGRGIGTALMRAAGEWARRRGGTELVLTVWSDNGPAEALYRRLGYQPIARILRKTLDD